MATKRFVAAVAQHLATRLHHSGTAFRCRCGGCRHQIVVTARRSGIDIERLVAALPPERPRKESEQRRPGIIGYSHDGQGTLYGAAGR